MPSSVSASDGAYSPADRLLHRLALSWRPVMETSFDLEWGRFGKAATAASEGRPIFVCGLARSGTSIAARLIAAAPGIVFPSYRDMPFPLAPNLWAAASGRRRRVEAAERGHGDGLSHDLDTPEAIEEAFWRCFEGRRYRRRDGIAAVAPQPETMASFRKYMALVALRGGGGRYASKNNNNVVRLGALAEALPDALFVHPFRHPEAQAESLRQQHERACASQRRDPFRLSYANWLGHHEFGLGRLLFLLPREPVAAREDGGDYWLASWASVYRHLLDQPDAVRERQFFLDHDALRRSPAAVLAGLARFLGMSGIDPAAVRPPTNRAEPAPSVPAEVERLHARLVEAAHR